MQTKRSGSPRAGGVGTTLSLTLLAALLTAATAFYCFKHLQPKIESDLTSRVSTALQGANAGASNFKIDGQNVILTGAVATEADRKLVEETAISVYGVSGVTNEMTIDNAAPGIAMNAGSEDTSQPQPLVEENPDSDGTPATLTIVVNNGRVNAQGIVSDKETITRINTALGGKFGSANLKDEISTYEGSQQSVWMDGMISMIDQLDGIKNPVLKVTGQDLVFGGSVNAEDIRRAKLSIAERLLGRDLNIIDNLTVTQTGDSDSGNESENPTPATSTKRPASVEISSRNNQISLTGFVANAADAAALRNGLTDLFGSDDISEELTIDDKVAKAAWIDDALRVTAEIRDISNFGISVRGSQMLLTGAVQDRETSRDLSIAATEIAGDKLGVLNNFSLSNVTVSDSREDILAQSLMQELEALPTRNIIFNKSSATLTDRAQQVLDDVAAAILGYDDLVVEIAGHTDSSGDAVRNLRLSKQRATAVRDYLVEQNVPTNRLSPIGYGETAPISDNETANGRAANRRIEFNL